MFIEIMTENLAEDMQDYILGSSSDSSDDEDNQNRRSSYADNRRSKYSVFLAFKLRKRSRSQTKIKRRS